MEPIVYSRMAAVEDNHWWFSARRSIVNSVLSRLPLPSTPDILEVGCGSGGNLAMLAEYGQVYAVEPEPAALALAEKKKLVAIKSGMLPNDIPFDGKQFDLIVLFDVLEHVDEDQKALQTLRERLKPGGWLVLTVPAFGWLWSQHDVVHHHHRRYAKQALVELVRNTGLSIYKASHFNFWLFPLIALVRLIQKGSRHQSDGDGLSLPAPWLNHLLYSLFASERHLMRLVALPFGVSLILCAQNVKE
ncbi:MAG: class I SAM-dependent methyltransferase [Mariprofundaceae bacterium]